MKKKFNYYEEWFFRTIMFLSSLLIIVVLGIILFSVLKKGMPFLTWEMISQPPRGGFYFGKEGGILNAIIGSLYLAFGATTLALCIGLPVAFYLNIYLIHKKKLVNTVRFFLDLLWGVPSIVYGAFGFMIMIYFGFKSSLLAGIIVVTIFILPIMIRALDEALKSVPIGLFESSLSLGATTSEISFSIYARQCFPCIITAILLSFGRAIGDAAAVLFTAGFTDHIPTSFTQPTATLPLAIFFQLSSPIPQVRQRAYAAAVILTFIILIISIITRIIVKKYQRSIIKF